MANTQTAVPLFVANAVLTAAQQNISAATGVPVFATTVTRDAAFGGSNKALAEGQLCYLESTNVVQYYDGAAWATVGPNTAVGLVCIKAETSFASNTAAVDNIFSSTYTFYRMMINYQSSASEVLMRFRVGGVAATTNYFYQLSENYSTTFTGIRTSSSSSVSIGRTTGGAFTGFAIVDLFGPALATPTRYQSAILGSPNGGYDSANDLYGGANSSSTAFDGFDINVSSGTLTGSFTIYGYGKTV